MKKNLIACGLAALLIASPQATIMNATSASVYAASEINFDQGSQSDEEYVQSVIDQFMALENLHAEVVNKDQADFDQTIDIDTKNLIVRTETTGEFGGIMYSYDDGTTAQDAQFEIDLMKQIYSDSGDAVDEVAKELEGKYIVNQYPEAKGQISQMIESYKNATDNLKEYENKDGVVTAYSEEMNISDNKDFAPLAEIYGENTTVKQGVIVDPKAETLTFETIIDIDEEALEETEPDGLGISFNDYIQDSTSQVVLTPGSETLPALEDLDTISKEDLDKLLEEKGVKPI